MVEDKAAEKAAHWEQLEAVDVPDVPEELLRAWTKAVANASASRPDSMAGIESRLAALESMLRDIHGLLKTGR